VLRVLAERVRAGRTHAVYGASAGAITAAWLLSSNPGGLLGWIEPTYAKTLIRRSGLLRGRPAVDGRTLIEELYQTTFPMDFASVLASPVEYHPADHAHHPAPRDPGPARHLPVPRRPPSRRRPPASRLPSPPHPTPDPAAPAPAATPAPK
jgi:hypothetical protein